jgi:hypothetical protein
LAASVAVLVVAVVLTTIAVLGRHPVDTEPVVNPSAGGKAIDDPSAGLSAQRPEPASGGSVPIKEPDDPPVGRTTRAPGAGAGNLADGKVPDSPAPRPPAQPPEPERKERGDLPKAVQALVDGLNDEAGSVRRTSAESLGKMGARARGAVPALARRVADDVWIAGIFADSADPHGGGKAAALEALKKLAPDRVQGALLQAMKSKNSHVKAWATAELGRADGKGEPDQ